MSAIVTRPNPGPLPTPPLLTAEEFAARYASDCVELIDGVVRYSHEQLPKGDVPAGLMPVAPEVVFEVRSSSDTWTEVFVKVGEYLRAGVRVVVVIDNDSQSASVYRPDAIQQTLYRGQDLAIPDVLPGFAVAVEKLFA